MVLLLLSLLARTAMAGEIQVDMDTPVLVYVNGAPVPNPTAVLQVTAHDLPGGPATVEIRNLLGRVIVQANVTVPADLQVRLRYTRKQLVMLGTSPIGIFALQAPAPVPTPAPAPMPAPTPAPPPAATGSGSLEIVGFDARTGGIWVDGVSVPYSAASDSFPALGLSAGTHTVRIENNRRVRFEGSLEVRAGQNNHCLLDAQDTSASMDCFFAHPALVASGGALPSPVTPAAPAAIPVTPAAPVAPPPAPAATSMAVATTGPVDVVFVLKDTMDMCNVYVDGARVAEFRTGDAEKHVSLSRGTHTVEIRDFTEFETWHKGVLTVSGSDAMRVGFGQTEDVEVYNREAAWQNR